MPWENNISTSLDQPATGPLAERWRRGKRGAFYQELREHLLIDADADNAVGSIVDGTICEALAFHLSTDAGTPTVAIEQSIDGGATWTAVAALALTTAAPTTVTTTPIGLYRPKVTSHSTAEAVNVWCTGKVPLWG